MTAMLKELHTVLFLSGSAKRWVNSVTLYRVVAAPFLLVLLFTDHTGIFKWLLLLSFLTDAIDGYLARKLHAATLIGTKLDSIGDLLTLVVAVTGIFTIYRGFVAEQAGIILSLIGLYALQTVFALVRYKRISSFHTYLSKVTAVVNAGFMLSVFFFGIYYPLFYTTVTITFLELAEELLLVFLIPKWKSNVKGVYWVWPGKQNRGRA